MAVLPTETSLRADREHEAAEEGSTCDRGRGGPTCSFDLRARVLRSRVHTCAIIHGGLGARRAVLDDEDVVPAVDRSERTRRLTLDADGYSRVNAASSPRSPFNLVINSRQQSFKRRVRG